MLAKRDSHARAPAPETQSSSAQSPQLTAGQCTRDLLRAVALQREIGCRIASSGIQLRIGHPSLPAGPASPAARSFLIPCRLQDIQNKSVVCNVLFLNLLGALLAVSRSITLTTSITIRRRSPAEGGQAPKPVEFSLKVASPKSKISRGLRFQEFRRLIPLRCNGITWRQQNHTVPIVIS